MKKLIVPISLLVMALAVAAMLPALVSAETTSDWSDSCYTFTKNFGVGSEGDHVARLTRALIKDGELSNDGKIFDEDLAAAIVKFQNKYGIPTTGYVGPLTRAKLNSLFGCGTQGNSTSVRYECPPGYVCTPVGRQTNTTLCPVGYTCTANGSTNLPNSTEKGDAAYNFFVTLLHRVPDTQGPGWDYFKYYSGTIDQMRQEVMSGIEYTTKQKITQIFREVYNREPNDLELTKWYYVAEYNNYNVDVVRAALGGKTPVTNPTPVVQSVPVPVAAPTSVQSAMVCPTGFTCTPTTSTPATLTLSPPAINKAVQVGQSVGQVFVVDNIPTGKNGSWNSWTVAKGELPPGISLNQYGAFSGSLSGTPTTAGTYSFMIQAYNTTDNLSAYAWVYLAVTSTASAAAPTATLTIAGEHSHTYNVGEVSHYEWSSTNADTFRSYAKSNDPAKCGQGPWVATTAGGSSDINLLPQWAGCVWTVTYNVKNSSTGKTAMDSVVVTVSAPQTNTTSSDVLNATQ